MEKINKDDGVYYEYKAPKRNPWWRIIVWGLLVLNVATFFWNLYTGSWVIWIAVAGTIASIYNIYMHHVKGIDLWN